VNGEQVEASPYFVNNTAVLPGRDLTIGVDVWYQGLGPYTDVNVGYFDGKIDELRIYNRALNASEIAQLYRGGTGGITIRPAAGGDTGTVSARITGSGFANGAAVKLTRPGQTDIVAGAVTVGNSGTTIDTAFDFTGKAKGLWDLVVRNPDSTTFTLSNGFTIEEGRTGAVWVDVLGPRAIRAGQARRFYLVFGNRGNIDAVGANVWLDVFAANASLTPYFPALVDGRTEIGPGYVPAIPLERSAVSTLPVLITNVPPGYVGMLPFDVDVPVLGHFDISLEVTAQ
jgi:hypothetical protein